MIPEEARGILAQHAATVTGVGSGNGVAPADQTTPGASKGQPAAGSSKRKLDPVRALVGAVETACDLVNFAGAAYAVPRAGSAWADGIGIPGIAQAFGAQLRRKIVRLASTHPDIGMIGRDAADKVLLNLEAEAFENHETPLGLRFYHLPNHPSGERVYLDLGQPWGKCVEIKPSEWSILDSPPPGVVFRRSHATRALPMPARRGRLDSLADLLALDPGGDEFRLILGWALALPFESSVRPGILLTGPPGSGKSTRLRLATSLWEPSDASALGSTFGTNHGDDQVRSLHRAIPLWDNLTSVSGATSDLMCCLVTGTSLEGRRLYSNADLDSNPIRRPVGLTAVGVPAGLRSDALDRLIAVGVSAPAERIADAKLQAQFDGAHPQLLGAACTAVAAALAWRSRVAAPTRYRMAAYTHTLAALDAAGATGELPGCPGGLLTAYDKALRETRQRTAAEDAFGGPLIALLERNGGTWAGKASELRDVLINPYQAGGLAAYNRSEIPRVDITAPGWPKTARRVPEVLAHLRDGLAELGVTYEATTVRGSTRYSFTMGDENPPENLV